MDILDNQNIVDQRDPDGAYKVIANEWQQLTDDFKIEQAKDVLPVQKVVVAGMGGSALAADLAKDWLDFEVPYEVVKDYDIPAYVDEHTLFIANSFSGNTEETLEALDKAMQRGAQVIAIGKGGKLLDVARERDIPFVTLVWDYQPRMGMFFHLRALVQVLVTYGVVERAKLEEMAAVGSWLQQETAHWEQAVPGYENLAKQLAVRCAGKTPLIYAGDHAGSLAYKWKISFNENSKNVAFTNEFPEFNHNELTGWGSHPVEKPFAIINLRSSFDHPRITRRFEVTEKLLSGLRPAAKNVDLQGDTKIAQLLWGCVLADFVSVYLGILNGVNPMRVELVEKLKKELD